MAYLIPGVDLLSLPCITAADVQQAIAQAKPLAGFGLVVVSDTAPDVVANPELAGFIWLESVSSIPIGNSYYYDGVAWAPLVSPDGEALANNSVPLNKLKLTGAAPYYIIQVTAAGTALQFISIPNAIQNGSLTLDKLSSVGATAFQEIRRNAGNTAWEAYTPLDFRDGEVYGTNVIPGATQDITLTKPANKSWSTFELQYTGCFTDNAVGGSAIIAFSWRTAPLMDTAILSTAVDGAGNEGQMFSLVAASDTSSPIWSYKGTVPGLLAATNIITIRATRTLVGIIQVSGVFAGKGVHYA